MSMQPILDPGNDGGCCCLMYLFLALAFVLFLGGVVYLIGG